MIARALLLGAVLLGAVLLGAAPPAAAEVSASVTTGFEDAVAPIAIGLRTASRRAAVGVEVAAPALRLDLDDVRGELYGELDLWRRSGWGVRVHLGASAVTTSNDAFDAIALGTVVGAVPGYVAPGGRWSAGAELRSRLAWATRLAASDYARMEGGATFDTGWYARTASDLQAGLRGAVRLGELELLARAGYERRGRYNLAIPPAYLVLGAALHF